MAVFRPELRIDVHTHSQLLCRTLLTAALVCTRTL